MGIKSDDSRRFEIKDEKIICSPLEFVPEPGGLGYEYFMAMKKHKNKVAQYILESGEEDTYGSLLQRSVRTALKLKSKGYDKDDIMCLCSNNHINSVVPFLAASYLTMKVCSLDPSLSQADVTHLIRLVKPSIFFVIEKSKQMIQNALTEIGIDAEIVVYNDATFDEYLEESEEEESFEPSLASSLHDTAVIIFSSGTTGMPKGICQSHYAIIAQSVNMLYLFNDIKDTDGIQDFYFSNNNTVTSVTLLYSSLYWISAILFFTAAVLSGTSRVVCSAFDPKQFWQILDKYKVSLTFLAPNQGIDILKVGRPDNIDTSQLNILVIGGATISQHFLKELREVLPGTFVCQGYGQTEVAGVLTCFRSNSVQDTLGLHYKPDSCGRPVPGVAYKIVDPETEQLCGPNERGELRVKTKFVMNGYYNMDSSESFDSEGWLKTGDVVYFDEELFFYIVDRIKDMLKYRSWHVPPAVLEKVLTQHPAVHRAVVIGLPHEEDGDHPMGVVVKNADFPDVSAKDIEDFVNERVDDRHQLRGGVKLVDEIPLTPSGKIRRSYIKKLVLDGKI